jgi:uncharacterized CHY-type Zn-finger protein
MRIFQQKILYLRQVKSITGFSKSITYARISAGVFLRQVPLGARLRFWFNQIFIKILLSWSIYREGSHHPFYPYTLTRFNIDQPPRRICAHAISVVNYSSVNRMPAHWSISYNAIKIDQFLCKHTLYPYYLIHDQFQSKATSPN